MMWYRMSLSQRRVAAASESMDRVGRGGGGDIGFEARAIHHIDPPVEQAGDIFLDPSIPHRPTDGRRDRFRP